MPGFDVVLAGLSANPISVDRAMSSGQVESDAEAATKVG
jgi:hypothetical protein